MQMPRVISIALVAAAMCVPSAASACLVGGDQILFVEPVETSVLPGAKVIHVQLSEVDRTNYDGPVAVTESHPAAHYTLIAMATRLDNPAEGPVEFPVLAQVTSCTHFLRAEQTISGEFYLIGQFSRSNDGIYFLAGGSSAGASNEMSNLTSLFDEEKFKPHGWYTGVDLPEDREPLETAVNGAIDDIGSMPEPLDPIAVRQRLSRLIRDTDLFATEDRDQVARYAVRIWQAAGFDQQSELFRTSDDKVLESLEQWQKVEH